MSTAVLLFTSDLRLHDQPALHAAVSGADTVVPLFVHDRGIAAAGFDAPVRRAFLDGCLADLDAQLRERGGRLVVRTGDPVAEVCRIVGETGARQVHLAAGVSRYATRREARLRTEVEALGAELRVHDAVITALPPGWVTPADRDHFAVFTPYFRRWESTALRQAHQAPRRVTVPDSVHGDEVGDARPADSAGWAAGESAARRKAAAWLRGGLDDYPDRHDDLAGDATSRLSPYLHFGCLSPVELVHRVRKAGGPGADPFVRQLAWRDFHHQVLAARPDSAHSDYRDRGDRWRHAPEEFAAWQEGRTGYPLVDAAMRQLQAEGWMHNRGRMLVASFLTKTLYLDWRLGADHFLSLLVDGDMANNQMNWQWAAGTGTDTRPNRTLNPLTQAKRFDAQGTYAERWVPELGTNRYPDPMVDLAEARHRFEAAREGRAAPPKAERLF